MSDQTTFEERCRIVFAETLGHGRRWKTACAQALGIGRATLYRYLEGGTDVPRDVLKRLSELEGRGPPIRGDREMVVMYASALVEAQRQLDERGWLAAPYPQVIRRAFDLGAARNYQDGHSGWPTDLDGLSRVAPQPLFRWVRDLSWDKDEEYLAARLICDGEITNECRQLAMGGDPEREIEENLGYELLMGICRERIDGADLYRTWRRLVVENPVLQNWSSTLLACPMLVDLPRIDEVVDAFYQRVPESIAIQGFVPVCDISGVILRFDGQNFHTEYRHPEAIRRASSAIYKKVRYRSGLLHLRRAFRTFWCLPGKTEIDLAQRMQAANWSCTLWPCLDRVDLVAVSPDGERRIAVDVKDYLSPASLAARFSGFKEYAADHECYLVVPDYIPALDPKYAVRFETFRASYGKSPVALRTMSALLEELGA